jgi:hypothetical protein
MPKQSDDLELGQVHQHKLAPGQLHNFPSKSRLAFTSPDFVVV